MRPRSRTMRNRFAAVLVLALVDWAASRGFVKRHMAEHAKVREQLLADVQRLRKEKRHEAGD